LAYNFSNTAPATTLANAVSPSDTTIDVTSASGFPSQFPYSLVVDFEQPTAEVVTVTNASGNTLTVIRGEDGTSAVAHSAGAPVRHAVVARDLRGPSLHIEATSGVHGLSGGAEVVGTTSTQTLTNKTLTSPTINNAAISDATISGGSISDAAIAVSDADFTVTDDADSSKQVKLDASGISTSTTRTLTVPNASGTLTLNDASQTLSNKTLASPMFSGIGHVAFAYKTEDEDVVSSTTLQDDNHLSVVVEAGIYILRGMLTVEHVTTSPSIDFKFKWVGPPGAVVEFFTHSMDPDDEIMYGTPQWGRVSIDETVIVDLGTTASEVPIFVRGMCDFATPGVFKLQWAQATSNANALRLHKYSYIELTRRA